MTDKEDNQRIFTNGVLTKIMDANGNEIVFVYNANRQLTSITRLNVGGTTETPASFTYNGSHYLTGITDAHTRTTNFTYSDGFLTAVTFPDNTTVSYTYQDGEMVNVYDAESDYGVEYETAIDSDSFETHTTVQEYFCGGNQATKTYGHKVEIHNNLGYYARYIDYGENNRSEEDEVMTTYRFDRNGRTITAYSSNLSYTKIYGASAAEYASETETKPNRIKSSAVTGIMPQNYVKNSSMENENTWVLNRAEYFNTYARTGSKSVGLNATSNGTPGGQFDFGAVRILDK